jgi:hypothetical protein
VTDEASQASTIDPGERQELEQLRAEVALLRAAQERSSSASDGGSGDASGRRPRRAWGRTVGATALILLAAILAPLSVVSVWARAQVTDTERYVQTVAPLADDPAVQSAIANSITDRVFEYIDIQGLTTQAFAALAEKGSLPPALAVQLQALAVPLANGVRGFAEDQVLNAVRSDVFASAWREANRAAHQQLVAALTGQEGSTVRIEGDAVTVDMAAFLTVVKQRLVSSGFQLAERIPAVKAEFVLFQSADVGKVQQGFNLLNTLGLWLPFVCLLLAGLGIYLARNHRQAFLGTGVGLAVAMLVTGAALTVARRAYLDGVPPTILPADAAAVLYDTLVRFLRDAIRAGFLIGMVVAAAAFFAGPSVTAVMLRRLLNAGFAAAKGGLASLGLDLDPVTRWVAPRAFTLRVGVLVAAFVVLLLQRYRTPELVGWVAVGVVVALAVIQFLAITPRPPRRYQVEPLESRAAPAPAPAG